MSLNLQPRRRVDWIDKLVLCGLAVALPIAMLWAFSASLDDPEDYLKVFGAIVVVAAVFWVPLKLIWFIVRL